MNKKEIINNISKKYNLKFKDCENFLNGFIKLIKDSLNNGEEILINGFGKWKIKEIKERTRFLPNLNKYKKFKMKIIPIFKPSKSFNIKIE